MNQEIKEKLAKIYELVNRGVDGEKEAAKAAMDRLAKKYNISDDELERINLTQYSFKYRTQLDEWLFVRLVEFLLNKQVHDITKSTFYCKEFYIELEYLDYVTLECAYEYFKRHMAKEWKRLCADKLKRYRKAKNRNKRRLELQSLFFSNYVIASKLYKEGETDKLDYDSMSEKEYKDRMALNGVKGGNYKEQMTTGLFLEK